MKNNKIIEIQEMLMREMKRLDDNNLMKQNGDAEISRCNALSTSATTFLKAVNTNIRILEISEKTQQQKNKLTKELGLENE